MEPFNGTFEERRAEFVKRYFALVEEMGVDYANYPMYTPNEKGEFVLHVQSMPTDVRALKAKKESFTQDAAKA